MRHKVFPVVLAAVLVMGAPSPVDASSSERPFIASVVGERGATPTSFVGTGIATHLGTFQFEGEREFGPFTAGCAPFLSLDLTFTAANRDELNVVGSGGEICIVSIDGSVVRLEANVGVDFVGGTGRFIDASGHAAVEFDITVSAGIPSFVGSYEGTIGY